jgi:hypothetical protein
MHHPKVNTEALGASLKKAAAGKMPKDIARSAKIDPSRVTRFLNGDFKTLTPVLRKLCATLGVPVERYLLQPRDFMISEALLTPLYRIVGKDPKKIRAAARLLRCLETLTADRTLISKPTRRTKAEVKI